MRVLVIGGAGSGGEEIARSLQRDPGIEVVRAHGRRAALALLRGENPRLLVDCAGPFRAGNYRLAHATLAAGAHYLDLAGTRAHVCAFRQALDAQARAAGRVAICGAGLMPALTASVVDQLAHDMAHVDGIDILAGPGLGLPGLAGSALAGLACCVMPLRAWRQGRWQARRGWQDAGGVVLPGGRARALPCDAPELELFPPRYRVRDFVRVRAAAGRAAQGTMRIDMWGERQGRMLHKRWELQAPRAGIAALRCLPAALLAQRMAVDPPAGPGAYRCMGYLRLAQFNPPFRKLAIATRLEESESAAAEPA